MFYSQVILARKGPLGKIWLAAHFDKKLTKNQIFTTDISESVDSVLNPPAPLALRVSGHLMLGIVRIYSRKVKYLMADCTEAMWKIKLAFRPGNVDLADAQSATLAIDDTRFFGNIIPDQDYPELEDIAFSQNMLSNFVSLQAARGRTIASQQDTTQDENDYRNMNISESPMLIRKRQTTPLSKRDMNRSLSLLDMGHIPGEDNWKGGVGDSVRSRLSDIELMRGEMRAERSISGDRDRNSLSTLRSSFSTGGALAMRFDDDIPAFEDPIDGFGNDDAPPLNYYQDNYDDNMGDPVPIIDSPDEQVLRVDGGVIEADAEGQDRASSPSIDVPDRVRKVRVKKAAVNRAKKQRVAVDESVELSSRAIKQRMSDMAPILRRRPGDYLPRLSKGSVGSSSGYGQQMSNRNMVPVPPSARGLCPELQNLFAMTMTSSDHLPFPMREAERREGELDMYRGNGRESIDIEALRDGSVQGSSLKSRRASSLLLDGEMDAESIKGHVSPLQDIHDFGDEGAFEHREEEVEQIIDYNENYNDDLGNSFIEDNLNKIYGEGGSKVEEEEEEDIVPGALKSREGDLMGRRNRVAGGELEGEGEGTKGRIDDFSARTAMVRDVLKDQLKGSDSVSFSSISKGISRRTAAACFLEVLQLKTWGYIDCSQERPFADIHIAATDKLWLEPGVPA